MRSLFAKNGLPTVDGQHRLGDTLINWTWSHHQFETERFSVCGPTDRVNVIFCCFWRSSKRPADSNVGRYPIRPSARDKFFEAE